MKVSIITASYNYAQYIEKTINSVINQSYSDWEMIIVDDGSNDNSVEIIKSYCKNDSRIRLLQHENAQNKGLKETLLLGIEYSSGDWIAFLESDDFFDKDNLLKKVEIIQKNPSVKLVFNKVEFISEEGVTKKRVEDLEAIQNKISKTDFAKNMFYEFYIYNQILTFSCAMVESQALKSLDFNTPTDAILDWWLWVHLAYKNDFYYIDEKLTHWRRHRGSYILKKRKPMRYFIQVRAYNDVYKNNPKDFKLLSFILYSLVALFFIRIFKFVTNVFRKLKRDFKIGQ